MQTRLVGSDRVKWWTSEPLPGEARAMRRAVLFDLDVYPGTDAPTPRLAPTPSTAKSRISHSSLYRYLS